MCLISIALDDRGVVLPSCSFDFDYGLYTQTKTSFPAKKRQPSKGDCLYYICMHKFYTMSVIYIITIYVD